MSQSPHHTIYYGIIINKHQFLRIDSVDRKEFSLIKHESYPLYQSQGGIIVPELSKLNPKQTCVVKDTSFWPMVVSWRYHNGSSYQACILSRTHGNLWCTLITRVTRCTEVISIARKTRQVYKTEHNLKFNKFTVLHPQ